MKPLFRGLYTLVIGLLILSSCTDPTKIGADLLEEDQADVDFTDTLSIRATTVTGDSVRTYSPAFSLQLNSYLFGDFADPFFGKASSSLYFQTRLDRLSPDFEGAELDSIVLVLPYDGQGVYGDISQNFGIEVLRVMEDIPFGESIFSDKELMVQESPLLGSLEFRPRFDTLAMRFDTVQVIDYRNEEADTLRFPHLRVSLDQAFGNELLMLDTNLYKTDTSFIDYFKGVHIRPSKETAGMLSFALRSSLGGIYLYYRVEDTIRRQFVYELNDFSVRFANYKHDYTGAPVNSFIDNTALGDSLIFIQGMQGLNARLEFPHIENLKGIIVNDAELEVNTADLPGDDPVLYSPLSQLLVSSKTEEGVLNVISDISFSGSNLSDIFGGDLQSRANDQPGLYRMKLSSHFQKMIDGDEPNVIYLSAFPKNERAFRVILRGGTRLEFPVKLRLTYTKP